MWQIKGIMMSGLAVRNPNVVVTVEGISNLLDRNKNHPKEYSFHQLVTDFGISSEQVDDFAELLHEFVSVGYVDQRVLNSVPVFTFPSYKIRQ